MPITPENIFNYSKEEREKRYKDIIDNLIKQKEEITSEKNKILEDLKKLPKSKLKKEEAKHKNVLNGYMSKINKLTQTIQILKNDLQDKWIPAPLYSIQEKKVKKEKINEEIEPNHLKIYIGKLSDYKNGKNVSIGLKLILEEKKKEFKENVEASNQECTLFEKSVDWDIEKEFKNLHKEKLRVKLRYKSFFRTHIEGLAYIALKELKNNLDIIKELPLKENLNQDIPPKIEIKIQIRNPCVGQAYEEIVFNNYAITKQFPSFKDKSALNQKVDIDINNVPHQKIEIEKPVKQQKIEINKPTQNTQVQNKPTQKTQVQNKPKTQQNKTENQNKNVVKKEHPHIDKSQFKEEELSDPDIIDNLVSVGVLEYKDKEIQEKINKIEGRTPRNLREKSNRIKVKINFIKGALGDTINPEGYVNIMRSQLEHDKLLYQYFIQEKDNAKSNIVKIRIQLLFKEINETEQYIKQGGK